MAQELVTLTWCDVHQDKGDQVPGRPWSLLVVGPDDKRRSERTVDLCDDCATDAGLASVSALVAEFGRASRSSSASLRTSPTPPGRTAPTGGEEIGGLLDCPRCDRSYSDRNKLSAHARRKHDVSLGELLGEPTPFVCEECGAVFGKATGLGVHQTRAHGGGAGS